jgi:phosphoribosylformylglycinamidine (FGAM) synthase-like enzyme
MSKGDVEKAIAIAKKHSIGASIIGKIVEGSDVVLQKGGKKISLL